MDRIDCVTRSNNEIIKLDNLGYRLDSEEMRTQYKKRNSFGLDLSQKIYRIFQKDFFDKDVKEGYLTLPKASSTVWKDPLGNPLSDTQIIDPATGKNINLG